MKRANSVSSGGALQRLVSGPCIDGKNPQGDEKPVVGDFFIPPSALLLVACGIATASEERIRGRRMKKKPRRVSKKANKKKSLIFFFPMQTIMELSSNELQEVIDSLQKRCRFCFSRVASLHFFGF